MVSVPSDRTYVFDANNGLSDASAAYTATGYAQYAGVDAILDLGGNQGVTVTQPSIADVATITPQQARIDLAIVIDVTAIKISSGDEKYKLIAVASNDPAFAVGNVQMVGEMMLGKGTQLDPVNSRDSVVGRYEILAALQQANTRFEYLKLYNVIAGTTPTITYRAFAAVLPIE